jgi:hypothetical protein
MTITFQGDEWDKHVGAIESWRHERDLVMAEAIKAHLDPQTAGDVFMCFNQKIREKGVALPSPLDGCKLNVS